MELVLLKNRPKLTYWAIFCAFFALLALTVINTVGIDELYYMAKCFSWGHLFNMLKDEGKEPFPLWIARPFVHLLGFEVPNARLASCLFGAGSAVLLAKICDRKGISPLPFLFTLLTSAFFVFYSRVFLYEIFVIFHAFWLFYGITLLSGSQTERRGLIFIFLACFFGMMTKRNFAFVAVLVPVLIWLESPNSRRVRVGTLSAVGGCALMLLVVALGGYWEIFLKFSAQVTSRHGGDASRTWLSWDLVEFLWVDVGPGILGAWLALALYSRNIWALVLPALFVLPNHYSAQLVMARYFVVVLPLFLFLILGLLNRVKDSRVRTAILAVLVVGQLVPLVRTTGPLFFDLKRLHWTGDENRQHISGYAPGLGYFGLEKAFLENSKDRKAELECRGDFAHTLCLYWPVYFPDRFKTEQPKRHYLFLRSEESPEVPPGGRLIFSQDQSTAGSPEPGFISLFAWD